MKTRSKYSTITLGNNSSLHIAYFSDNTPLLTNCDILTHQEQVTYNLRGGDKRKEEYLLVRWLAKEAVGETILYKDNGAPYILNNRLYISISHCPDAVILMVSSSPCGVDIERIDRNFERAANRFITSQDLPITDKKHQAWYWCTKEAVFKAHSGSIKNILSDIVIEGLKGNKVYSTVDKKSIVTSIIYRDSLIISHTIIK